MYFCIAMSIKCNIPQVNALRKKVEEKVGYQALTHTSFISLSYDIERITRNHISESTLERLWGYSTRKADVVSVHTLNVLSVVVGAQNWNDFCRHLAEESEVESDVISGNILDSDSLRIGGFVRIGWYPDRQCICKYLGGHRFIVEQSVNTKVQPGDTFSCIQFQLGRELYLDKFVSRDGNESRYVVGQRNGLTTLDIVLADEPK